MKKLIIGCIIAAVAVFAGCKSVPTTDQMYTTSYAVGTASGLVANMTKINDEQRNAVIEIMNTAEGCIPETNQTFSAAWMPIAEVHVAKLIQEGKVDVYQGKIILKAFQVAVNGIDYLFNVRFPNARQYQELTEAAVHGFCGGFLTVFKPANVTSTARIEIDEGAYNYLIKQRQIGR